MTPIEYEEPKTGYGQTGYNTFTETYEVTKSATSNTILNQ